jgi:SAM-dependent methyltransferase
MGDQQVRAYYDQLSEVYDQERNQRFFAHGLTKYRQCLAGAEQRVLEIGCGTGSYLVALRAAGIAAFGVDFSPRMCAIARHRLDELGLSQPSDEIVRCADVEETLGFAQPFSAIVIMDCWECFPRPERVLAQVSAALLPGGRLLLFTPNPRFAIPLKLLEWSGIKKLKPAFLYHNSTPSKVQASVNGHLQFSKRETLFFGLEQVFTFTKEN